MSERPAGYVPAAGHDHLLPLYDPMVRVLGREKKFRGLLLAQAGIGSGDRVLDVGCGTGSFAVLVKERCPGATVVGVDGDAKALAIARRKAARRGVVIQLDEALATALPYPDASFDRVTSSLVLHHLTRDEKRAALAEIRRVLRPGGTFHLADFGPPVGWLARLFAFHVGGDERGGDNREGRLPGLVRDSGFVDVSERGHEDTLFGSIHFLSARRPDAPA
jgi:ubiquinone/menaquinone biosynthesis C-methylase UbiE